MPSLLQQVNPPPRIRPHAAFTLIELLVVISIIALLLSILLPSLIQASEKANTAKCLANLRTISIATQMYRDNDDQAVIPWYQVPPLPHFGAQVVSPWVFGGFKAPDPQPIMGLVVDSSVYPAQVRPLNRYIEPSASG